MVRERERKGGLIEGLGRSGGSKIKCKRGNTFPVADKFLVSTTTLVFPFSPAECYI